MDFSSSQNELITTYDMILNESVMNNNIDSQDTSSQDTGSQDTSHQDITSFLNNAISKSKVLNRNKLQIELEKCLNEINKYKLI